MRVEDDKVADARYIYLTEEAIAVTEPLNDSIFVDVDADGYVVGIEILTISTALPVAEFAQRFKLREPLDLLAVEMLQGAPKVRVSHEASLSHVSAA